MITVTKISFLVAKIIGLIIGCFGLWFIIDGIKGVDTLGILEIVPGFALFFFGSFLIILVFFTEGKTKLIKYPLIVITLVILIVIGICVYFEYFHRVSITQSPEIKKQENVVKDETADWQTYRNEEYGFEMKYPESWEVRGDSNGVIIGSSLPTDEWHPVAINIYSESVDQLISQISQPQEDEEVGAEIVETETEDIEINNIRAKRVVRKSNWREFGADRSIHTIFPEGEITFDISLRTFEGDENQDVYNQILSTFRFRESVSLTEVIQYIPTEIPDEVCEGACDINAYSTMRRDAWRCMVGNSIYDPCFIFEKNKSLVCDPYPPTGDKGILLKLTEPLPEPNIAEDKFGEGWAWLIELEDGITCRFITGATGGINNERINYYCSDDSFVIGDLEVGTIWKAKKVDNPQTKSIEVVSIKKVWQ